MSACFDNVTKTSKKAVLDQKKHALAIILRSPSSRKVHNNKKNEVICSQVHKTEGSGATDGMSLSSLRQPLGSRKYLVIPLYMQHICSQHTQPVTMSK